MLRFALEHERSQVGLAEKKNSSLFFLKPDLKREREREQSDVGNN